MGQVGSQIYHGCGGTFAVKLNRYFKNTPLVIAGGAGGRSNDNLPSVNYDPTIDATIENDGDGYSADASTESGRGYMSLTNGGKWLHPPTSYNQGCKPTFGGGGSGNGIGYGSCGGGGGYTGGSGCQWPRPSGFGGSSYSSDLYAQRRLGWRGNGRCVIDYIGNKRENLYVKLNNCNII